MTSKLLNVVRLSRWSDSNEEFLTFVPGVNVVVGETNTGKTRWLSFLDYLLGDTDPPEDTLGRALADKYDGAAVRLTIDGNLLVLERRWHGGGQRTKVLIDGTPVPADKFSDAFLEMLGLPRVRFPKGNPYSGSTWPSLSWRMLLRHIYRVEWSWSELAAKQVPAEQHAVLMMFAGVAPSLFSTQLASLVDQNSKRQQLEAQRANFESMLQEFARDLVTLEQAGVGLTPDALRESIETIKKDIAVRQLQRDVSIQALRMTAEAKASEQNAARASEVERLGRRLDELRGRRVEIERQLETGRKRIAEIQGHAQVARNELARLERARKAGDVLGELRVTHCPACDREIRRAASPDACFVCLQPNPPKNDHARVSMRMGFEVDQLAAEIEELSELLAQHEGDVNTMQQRLREIVEEIVRIEGLLAPVRVAAAWVMPPEIMIADQEIGRHQERLRQVERLQSVVGRREVLARELDELNKKIASLSASVAEQRSEPEYGMLSMRFGDAMTEYLNALHDYNPTKWGQGPVVAEFAERNSRFRVGGEEWQRKLGANLKAIFFLAYHYALLRLSRTEPFLYPGLVVLDFPPNLSDFGISDAENYLLAPFVKLLNQDGLVGTQLIAASRAFRGLEGAHEVSLAHRWT